MVRMHSIASSRLVSSSGGFRDRPSCLSTGCLSSELPAAHRRRVLLLLSFRALLGSLLSPFGSFLCPFGSFLSPFGSCLFLSCPLHIADGSYVSFLSQPIRVLSLCKEHRPLHIADGSVSCGVWERAARCTSQTGRSRVCHVRACVSWWCMCMMLL